MKEFISIKGGQPGHEGGNQISGPAEAIFAVEEIDKGFQGVSGN